MMLKEIPAQTELAVQDDKRFNQIWWDWFRDQQQTLNTSVWFNEVSERTGADTVVSADDHKTILLSGDSCYTLTFPATSTLRSTFAVRVVNASATRAKKLDLNGTNVWVWPLYSGFVFSVDGVWYHDLPQRWHTSGVTLFVHPTLGSDTNDGLAAGAGNALLTPSEATLRIMNNVDPGSGNAVNLADGTYSTVSFDGASIIPNYYPNSHGQVIWTGNVANPGNVIISAPAGIACFLTREPGAVATITGVKMQSGAGGVGIAATQYSVADFGAIEFGAFPGGLAISVDNAAINCTAACTITGGAAVWLSGAAHARCSLTSFTSIISAGLTFGTFIQMLDGAVYYGGMAFPGPGSGGGTTTTNFTLNAVSDGIIHTAGQTYPGTAANNGKTLGLAMLAGDGQIIP